MKSLRPGPPKSINLDIKNFFRPRSDVRRLLFILSFVLILVPSLAGAAQVSLAWKASTGPNVAGYKMHYGNYKGQYQYTVNVGKSTSCTISGLTVGKTYYFSATAYDSKMNESNYSNEISYKVPSSNPPTFKLEFGNRQVGHNWTRVNFTKSYTEPVVVAGSFGMNGKNPAVIRIQNVNNSGFDIRIQNWPYMSWPHGTETVSFLVMERGSHSIGNVRIEAGKFWTKKADSFRIVDFKQTFNRTPVVVSSINTYKETDAVTGRIRGITTQRFEYGMQEQDANSPIHIAEQIHYIAWEPSTGAVQSLIFDVSTTGNRVTDTFYRIYFHNSLNGVPSFLADMQTANGTDTANVRWRNKNTQSVEVQIDEEQSLDSETSHISEVVGYIAVSPAN